MAYAGCFLNIMRMTAVSISTMPEANRHVKISPKTNVLITTAVTGSSAPRMDVGVLPMSWMDTLIKYSDSNVGNTANCITQSHCLGVLSVCSGSPAKIIYPMMVSHPNAMIQKVYFCLLYTSRCV